MNIIVTGGAGFIGSNFVFHMLKKYPDYRIICLDKLTYAGNLSTLAPVIKKTIQWYLDNREWWETIISGEYQNYYEKMYGNR